MESKIDSGRVEDMDWVIALLFAIYGTLGSGSAEQPVSIAQLVQQAQSANGLAGGVVAGLAGETVNNSGTPVKRDPQPDTPPIRGIYVTAHSAGGERMESLLQLVRDTELNSMVIDVKDDHGYITYPTTNP